MTWKWQVVCSAMNCSYQSRWHRWFRVAQLDAFLHNIIRHPFGNGTITIGASHKRG